MNKQVLHTFFKARSPHQTFLIALIITAFLAICDYYTGNEMSFSIFYLVPVSLATWYAGKYPGMGMCLVAGVTWFVVDKATGHVYSHQAIPFWNAGVRLGFFLVTSYLLTEIKYHLHQEKKLARIDGLTGLLNSHTFKTAASRHLQLARRYKHSVAVGYIDLDNFKTVNDTLGHAEGDRVLQTTGGLLARSVRGTDIVGRLGGDEFAILLSETELSGTENVFEKLRGRLLQAVNDAGWPIGFSIGVAIFSKPPASIDAALGYADNLMYQIKKGGKNGIICRQVNASGDVGADQSSQHSTT